MDYYEIEQLVAGCKGTILDVRTPEEFEDERAEGTFNIPLDEIQSRMDEIKSMPQPVILCCASGSRSSVAELLLAQQGINCCNAGSWLDIDYIQTKNNGDL